MEYKKGYKIKPYEIKIDGSVRFTDGTYNNLFANQKTCEDYGYRYDKSSGTCLAYNYTTQVKKEIQNKSSSQLIGTKHTTQEGTLDTLISGNNNETKGNNSNCFISGDQNKVERDINNATVLGKMGKANHEGEVVIAGGGFNSEAGLLQMSVIQLSRRTTDATEVVLYVDGDADEDNDAQILLPANSVVTYEIWLSALVTGGSSGTAGDYEAYVFLGVIRTTNDGTMAHNAKIDRLLGRTGSLGTQTIETDTPYTLKLQVSGLANVNIQYHAVAKLHINKTNAVEI